MAPSAGKSPPGTQIGPPKMSTEISIGPNSQPKVNYSIKYLMEIVYKGKKIYKRSLTYRCTCCFLIMMMMIDSGNMRSECLPRHICNLCGFI